MALGEETERACVYVLGWAGSSSQLCSGSSPGWSSDDITELQSSGLHAQLVSAGTETTRRANSAPQHCIHLTAARSAPRGVLMHLKGMVHPNKHPEPLFSEQEEAR